MSDRLYSDAGSDKYQQIAGKGMQKIEAKFQL